MVKKTRRILSLSLMASLVLGTVPVMAAEKGEASVSAEPAGQAQPIRASIERVVVEKQKAGAGLDSALTPAERSDLASRGRTLPKDPVAGQGGGGKMMIIGLLTTALTLGATYMVMKKMREDVDKEVNKLAR